MLKLGLTWKIEPQKFNSILSCFCHCVKFRIRVSVGFRVRVRVGFRVRVRVRVMMIMDAYALRVF